MEPFHGSRVCRGPDVFGVRSANRNGKSGIEIIVTDVPDGASVYRGGVVLPVGKGVRAFEE
jgi:hypothetical protein